MKCEKCGLENESGKFCVQCGAPLAASEPAGAGVDEGTEGAGGETPVLKAPPTSEEASGATAPAVPPAPAAPERSVPIGKILRIGIPAVLVVVVLVALIAIFAPSGGSKYTPLKNDISRFSSEDSLVLSVNNYPKVEIPTDAWVQSIAYSMDGSSASFIADYDDKEGGSLWYLNGTSQKNIASGVCGLLLSDSGNGLAYLSDPDGDEATLWLYDTKAGKAQKIADNAYARGSSLSLSPDGKTVGYGVIDEDGTYVGYTCQSGKSPEKLGKNKSVLAIADGGKYVYYIKSTDGTASLYVLRGADDVKLSSVNSNYGDYFFNKDYSQVVFNYDGKGYISVKGGDKQKLTSSEIYDFYPPASAQFLYNTKANGYISTLFISDFSGAIVGTSSNSSMSLFRIDVSKAEYTAEKVVSINTSKEHGWELLDDGRTLVYLSNGKIYRIDTAKKDADKGEPLANDAIYFEPSRDGKSVFYLDEDRSLFVTNGKKSTKIADDVHYDYGAYSEGASNLPVVSVSGKLFYLADYDKKSATGVLYCADASGKKAAVSGADEVGYFFTTATSVFYTVDSDDGYTVYRSGGNEKFALFADITE